MQQSHFGAGFLSSSFLDFPACGGGFFRSAPGGGFFRLLAALGVFFLRSLVDDEALRFLEGAVVEFGVAVDVLAADRSRVLLCLIQGTGAAAAAESEAARALRFRDRVVRPVLAVDMALRNGSTLVFLVVLRADEDAEAVMGAGVPTPPRDRPIVDIG